MITLDRVTFRYPNAEAPVLDDVTLELYAGEFILLMGASGSGKSTLLRLLNGLTPHFSGGELQGDVRVNGLDPVAAGPQAMSSHVGFVFQDPEAQFVMDRVEDELAFALENRAMPPQEMRIRVEETLDLLDLAPLRNRALNSLSGGERQRVAIAAALALRPDVLVLDEPTSQLDPKSAEDVLTALVRLNQDLGLTVLLAEHRLERVLPFVDHIVFLPGAHASPRQPVISDAPRAVLARTPLAPPLVELGKALQWEPLPLTIKEAVRHSRRVTVTPTRETRVGPAEKATTPVLAVSDLHAAYGAEPVLNGVSLELRAGEILMLMGRNGSGKSTLLKQIVGLSRPQRGTVSVNGRSNAGREVADICRDVGYLPQDPNALLFADTVAQEVDVTLRNHGLHPDQGGVPPVDPGGLLDALGLDHKRDAYPRDLSVGERQRVALAAITVTRPAALLLDEPTRGLDYGAKAALARYLQAARDAGTAVLVVTHDVEFAAQLADRVVLMSQGEIIADGPPGSVMGASPLFAPQIARLFPGTGWLTTDDVAVSALGL